MEGFVPEDLEELEDLESVFEEAREETNTEWIFETGCSVYIDLSKITPLLVEWYKVRYAMDESIPLLLGQLTRDKATKELEGRLK